MKKIGGIKRLVFSTDSGSISSVKFKDFETDYISCGNRSLRGLQD
tara:strand:- start:238 stop:372 length:135 start_codon:yes stop_codon:yes gene_type:complete